MSKIKKRGLDYFPMSTEFVHDRLVHRIMKREGDAAFTALVDVFSYIYSGEGYYVCVDDLFYEDLAANLYEKKAEDVKRIVLLAVEYGIFDAGLFEKKKILSSAEIQRQYLFSTKRRVYSRMEPCYCLLSDGEILRSSEKTDEEKVASDSAVKGIGRAEPQTDDLLDNDDDVTFTPINVTSSAHSIAQYSIAQNRKNSTLNPSSGGTGFEEKREEVPLNKIEGDSETGDFGRGGSETCHSEAGNSMTGHSKTGYSEAGNSMTGYSKTGNFEAGNSMAGHFEADHSEACNSEACNSETCHFEGRHFEGEHSKTGNFKTGASETGNSLFGSSGGSNVAGEVKSAASKQVWTDEAINSLQPPVDGMQRNLSGLVFSMRQYHVPPGEQYAVIRRSNYGVIGHPVWKGFCVLRESHGKIHMPGRYLLSLCCSRSYKTAETENSKQRAQT